jgi:thiamine-phosphate pyrophosphorylase
MLKFSGLYVVTPDWDDTDKLLSATESALMGGAQLVQYRHKTANATLRIEQAEALLSMCRKYDVPLIINDHVDVCLAIGADGVHVGGTDQSVAMVRDVVGPDKIVGASCYGTFDLALQAQADGASYVAFGGFYPSRVKKYDFVTPIEIVAQAKAALTVPVVVIGGMTQTNAVPLVQAGADMVAAISSVYMADDVAAAANAFVEMIEDERS